MKARRWIVAGAAVLVPVSAYHAHRALAKSGFCYAQMSWLSAEETFEIAFENVQDAGKFEGEYEGLEDFAERNHPCCDFVPRAKEFEYPGVELGRARVQFIERTREAVPGRLGEFDRLLLTGVDRCGGTGPNEPPYGPKLTMIPSDPITWPISAEYIEGECENDYETYCPESRR